MKQVHTGSCCNGSTHNPTRQANKQIHNQASQCSYVSTYREMKLSSGMRMFSQ
jgi:hypothetical protein